MASVNGARGPDELNKHDVIRTSATTSFAWRLRCCGVVDMGQVKAFGHMMEGGKYVRQPFCSHACRLPILNG